MALPRAEVFEDELPLLRSCAVLNGITLVQTVGRLAGTFVMFLFGLRLLFQILNWIDSADNEERPRVRQTFVGADTDSTIILFGKDRQRRWSVQRWNPHLQQAERVADMEAGRWWDASYSVLVALCIPLFFRHHQTEESIFVVGGGRRVDEFLVREGRWRERAPLAVGRNGHAAAVVKVPTAAAADGEETLIGVFGGWGLSSCEVYEVRQDRWHKLPDLPEARARPAAACLPGDSRVFVFGGRDASRRTTLASVVFCHLRADWRRRLEATSADFWQSAAPMRTARWRHAATAFRGVILVAGGEDDRALNTMEMFTPPDASSPLGQWTELAHMQESRSGFTLLASTNAVFALGGFLGNTVEAFTAPEGSADPDNDLTAWVWSAQRPVETLSWVRGVASICM
ncbi:Kelch-like protein 36 [Sparganum proliferum]